MRRAIAERTGGLSLGTRIFLLMAAVIALSICLSVLVTSIGASRIARRAVTRALTSSQTAQTAFQEQRRGHLRILARSLALDPYVTAYAAEAEGTVYASSILHLLEQRRRDFDFAFAIVLDPQGHVLARTDAPGAGGADLGKAPLVAAALERGEAFGVWQQDGHLFDAVAEPLAREATVFGYFVVGFEIDDRQALEVKRISGADVAYLALAPQATLVVASTLDANLQAKLLDALQAGGIAQALAAPGTSGGAAAGAQLEFELDGRSWIAQARSLEPGSAAAAGATVALAPLDAELNAFRQIERLLVSAGAVAMLLAFGLSYALSRRTLRPVRQLAAAATAARHGDYDQRVEIRGGDEVAELARTFNTLLADLREKRDMETYIADLSRSLPAPAFDVAATAPIVTGATAPETLVRPPAAGRLDSTEMRPGTVLAGRYEIVSELGRGGMGVVLKALDRDLDEIVALKLLRPEIWNDPDMLERLKSEVRLARKITHPNVLRTFDFLELDGIPCISMEYVNGITLRALLTRSKRLPYSAGLHLARQLCAGLGAAHAQGVMHRDIKPENLVLQQNGTTKVMDFGIARPVSRSGPGQTQAGVVLGTPHYLAPEQIVGGPVDTRADIYACGVVLYEVFTGRLPFTGASPYDILVQHVKSTPVPPHMHWPEIPQELERLLLRCLEPSVENRYATVGELSAAIDGVRGESSLAPNA